MTLWVRAVGEELRLQTFCEKWDGWDAGSDRAHYCNGYYPTAKLVNQRDMLLACCLLRTGLASYWGETKTVPCRYDINRHM